MIAATPASSKRMAISCADRSQVSAQPWTATRPSRASSPTTMRLGQSRAACFTRSGSFTAAVPMMTRSTPFSSHVAIVALSRIPPPSCTGNGTLSRMRSIAGALTGRPANAPSKSTTCRYSNPSASKPIAWAAASRLNTVARPMSPCSRRTHTPSFRSIAGNRIKDLAPSSLMLRRRDMSRPPPEEICDQGKPQPLALFWVKLRARVIVTPDQGGDGPTIVAIRHHVGRVLDPQVVTVDEIRVQAGGPQRNAIEQGMRPLRLQRIPAHMRDLETRILGVDAANLAADPAESIRYRIFPTAVSHELHTDADAEKRSAFPKDRVVQGFDHAGHGIETSPTVRKRADPRQHDAICGPHHGRIARHRNRLRRAALACCPFKCLGGRMQIAGAVVANGDAHRPPPGSGNSPTISGWVDPA